MAETIIHPRTLGVPGQEHVHLKLTERDDASRLLDIAEAYPDLGAYQAWARHPDDLHEDIERVLSDTEAGTCIQYRIMHKGESAAEIIGGVTFYPDAVDAKAWNIGYWLLESFRGRGIAKRAVITGVGYVASALAIDQVGVEIPEENTPSQYLAQSVGARPTADVYDYISRDGFKISDVRKWVIDVSEWGTP